MAVYLSYCRFCGAGALAKKRRIGTIGLVLSFV
ncbi:hypothetical protein GGQ77_003277 [Geobacillus thermodenitrificans]|nr:hypothetical protein [Geobacillus thermodenitrificans]